MSSIKQSIIIRAAVMYGIVLVVAIGIIAKVVNVQLKEGDDIKVDLEKRVYKQDEVEANRGDILARDGRLLVTSYPLYNIHVDTRAGNIGESYRDSARLLGRALERIVELKSADVYANELIRAWEAGERFYKITRVNYEQLQQLRKAPLLRMSRYKGGLMYREEDMRMHTTRGLADRTLGYVNQDRSGTPGLEGAYDYYLKGEKLTQLMRRISGGGLMAVDNDVSPMDGGDVVTTIDINIQDLADAALRRQLEKHNAHHGTAVVMEVESGEVIAIVNLGQTEARGKRTYSEKYNYALGESIEPGSTFKLMSYMAAMEDGYINPEDSVNNGNGTVKFYDKIVHDDNRPEAKGKLTVEQAFAYSSNVSVTKLISKYYKGKERQFIDRLYGMGLNQALGLDISGEGTPYIKYPDNSYWSGLSLTQLAYGYELQLAPIQVLAFYNAVANNGEMVKPRFVKRLERHGHTEKNMEREVLRSSVASDATIRKAKRMMEAVVEYGTARRIKTDLYTIAGKSGTAQVANEKYGYGNKKERKYYASFVGYFPADKPKYSCIVSIYDPKQNGYGGSVVAAPVFKEIADRIYASDPEMHEKLTGKATTDSDIPHTKSGHRQSLESVLHTVKVHSETDELRPEWITSMGTPQSVRLQNRSVSTSAIPNVVDMGLKDAIFLMEERGIEVSVNGRGTVIAQSLPAGTPVKTGTRIVLTMSKQ